MWLGLIILLLICFFYIPLPTLAAKWYQAALVRKVRQRKLLVLTFDDGPGNRLTPAILDILAEEGVKATYFLLGRNIAGREQLVRRIADEGHEIGSHGFDHLNYWQVSPWRSVADIKQGCQEIKKVLPANKEYLFRPPNGKLNVFCLLYLWLRRAGIVYWTVDSGDTWPQDRRDASVMSALTEKAGGAVTLAHDFDRSTDKNDAMVLESLRMTLAVAKKNNLEIVTVSQLINH